MDDRRRENAGADAWVRRILTRHHAPTPDPAPAAPDPDAPWPSADQGNLSRGDYRDPGREAERARTALAEANDALREALIAAKRDGAAQQADVDRIGRGPKPAPKPAPAKPPSPPPRR